MNRKEQYLNSLFDSIEIQPITYEMYCDILESAQDSLGYSIAGLYDSVEELWGNVQKALSN